MIYIKFGEYGKKLDRYTMRILSEYYYIYTYTYVGINLFIYKFKSKGPKWVPLYLRAPPRNSFKPNNFENCTN